MPDDWCDGFPSHRHTLTGQCPICGATGVCPDAAAVPMPYPPVDVPENSVEPAGLVRPYTVSVYGYQTVMNLTESDAARYGNAVAIT